MTKADATMMNKVIHMARKMRGIADCHANNPVVAAIIVKDGHVVGKGVHRTKGQAHAERLAIQDAGSNCRGATLYVNLEPCTHHGANPPCTEAIVNAGISRVVYGIRDPNPLVQKGSSRFVLENNNVQVDEGVKGLECAELNDAYIKTMVTGMPFLTVKVGMSLDGRIALANGKSKYITNDKARREAHRIRSESDAIIVGVNTVIEDDPDLSIRMVRHQKPHLLTKIVLDSHSRVPSQAKVFKSPGPTIIANTTGTPVPGAPSHAAWSISDTDYAERWRQVQKHMIQQDLVSGVIEGGKQLFTSSIESGVVDRVVVMIAPKLLLSDGAIPAFGGSDIVFLEKATSLKYPRVRRLGDNTMISGYLTHPTDHLKHRGLW